MLSAAPFVIVAAWLVVLFAAPMDKTTIVLMPDPDGNVGQAVVSTEGGSQMLSEASQMTTVASAQAPPTPTSIMSGEKVSTMFAGAMEVEPQKPSKFTLLFLPDSTELTADSVALLDEVIAEIGRRGSVDVGIHGHSDRSGSKAYNDDLSMRRAVTVRNLLVEQGVDDGLIETASHGEGNPVVATPDNVVEPRNRRVEVIVR